MAAFPIDARAREFPPPSPHRLEFARPSTLRGVARRREAPGQRPDAAGGRRRLYLQPFQSIR